MPRKRTKSCDLIDKPSPQLSPLREAIEAAKTEGPEPPRPLALLVAQALGEATVTGHYRNQHDCQSLGHDLKMLALRRSGKVRGSAMNRRLSRPLSSKALSPLP